MWVIITETPNIISRLETKKTLDTTTRLQGAQLMKSRKFNNFFTISCLALFALASSVMARGKPEMPLTPEGQALYESYAKMLEGLKKEIIAGLPAFDDAKKASFVELHGAIAKLPKDLNFSNSLFFA